MVDAARQMLDELMGRNRNLHPSQAPKTVSWEDPDLCQYFLVQFCPHELFVNTRADLGPCDRIHDEEAKRQYEKAKPSVTKRQYEDEFLYFCNSMLNDVDRKILKGKQRLALIQKDQAPSSHYSRTREQLNNLNARIKKLLAEAEEAGTRGDVDQAKDLMVLCEQLKDERDVLMSQQENNEKESKTNANLDNEENRSSPASNSIELDGVEKSNPDSYPKDDDETSSSATNQNTRGWMDVGHLPEKQMEVCEVCGAFLIVGDAQQRIEDHLMGKQHLGYSKLRKAVEEIHQRRKLERANEEDRRGREDRPQSYRSFDKRRERDLDRDRRSRHDSDRHHRHHKSHRRRSRSRHHHDHHDRRSRSRSNY
ncbi:luc7-like protein 3 [Haematobia irritans]|uniref:luc7-like protein 3 n=1 Tax=Haematobia irritans TaxID=7368 RepID=UPI003F502702